MSERTAVDVAEEIIRVIINFTPIICTEEVTSGNQVLSKQFEIGYVGRYDDVEAIIQRHDAEKDAVIEELKQQLEYFH